LQPGFSGTKIPFLRNFTVAEFGKAMSNTRWRFVALCICCSMAMLRGNAYCRSEADGSAQPDRRYIGLDEIAVGMQGYCLTCYKGKDIEKFALEVKGVVRDIMPGRDAILVQGLDERFIHTGPVAGCSGSPVYIDGRLAGALAFGWMFSKDPLYGVRPIEEMLEVGRGSGGGSPSSPRVSIDYSKGLDLHRAYEALTGWTPNRSGPGQAASAGFCELPCVLSTGGVPPEACASIGEALAPLNVMAVSGGSGNSAGPTGSEPLVPGASLAVPLLWGDMELTVIGTVTEVIGEKVYGFGHGFLGYGRVNLPMATGTVHTVVSSLARSFKLATCDDIVGTLTADENAAVFGTIGPSPRSVPLTLKIDRHDELRDRLYNCRVVENRLFTPLIVQPAISGAAFYVGRLPPDHMVEYRVLLETAEAGKIDFSNISTGSGLNELAQEVTSSIGVLMNNPFAEVRIESIDVEVATAAKNVTSRIRLADVSDSVVEPGEEVTVTAVIEPFLAQRKTYRFSIKVPHNLEPGDYSLIVCGGENYKQMLRQMAPYRFVPEDISTLAEALRQLLGASRSRLYCLLVLPPDGIAVESAELPQIPATKALVMQDAKRSLSSQPYQRWIADSVETGTVVVDKKVLHLEVEQ